MNIIALGDQQAVSALRGALMQYAALSEDLPTENDLVELYQTSVVVFRAANKQASAVARVPMVARRKKADGTTEDLDPGHPLSKLFSARLTYHEMIRRTDITLSFWGANLLVKQRALKGQTEKLRWINPSLWRLDGWPYEGLRGFLVRDQFNYRETMLKPPDAVHMHLLDFGDDFGGIGPAEAAFRFAAADPELAQTILSVFRNRAIPTQVFMPAEGTNYPTNLKKGEESPAHRLGRVLRETIKGSKNAGRVVIDQYRWEIKELQQKFDEYGTREMDEAIVRRVAMAWDMPTSLLVSGDSSYAGQETDRREWYQGAVSARCDWYGMIFTEQVAAEFGEEFVIEPDYSEVPALKEDEATKTNVVTAQVDSTLISLYRAQEKLGEDPDEHLKDIYLLGGQPVLGSEIRKRAEYKEPSEFGLPNPDDGDEDQPDGADQGSEDTQDAAQVDDQAKPQPRRPQDTTNPDGRKSVEGFIPSRAWREFSNWQRLLERGDGNTFELDAIPPDVGAYVRLLLATGHEAGAAIEAARGQYRLLYPTGYAARDFNQTAALYRSILYDLIQQAFTLNRETGESTLPQNTFAHQGRQAISIYFQAAYLDGLQRSGVLRNKLDDDEQAELNLEISSERHYWSALSRELYGNMIPLYRQMLALQDDAKYAREAGDTAQAQELQRQALEALQRFQKMEARFIGRVDLWVNKGLRRIFNLGKMAAEKNPNVKWGRNAAKDSCRSCVAADGQVHPLKVWKRYGIVPQGDVLECGGFDCGCGWEKVAERAQGRIDRIPITGALRGLTVDSEVPVIASAMRSEMATEFGFAISYANDPALHDLVAAVRGQLPIEGFEWQSPYDWHLSLCYANGAFPMSVIASFSDDMRQLDIQPLCLGISHLEAWDTPDGVALVAIMAQQAELFDLQAQLHEMFVARGLPVYPFSEPEAYKPHITLAYAAEGTDLKGLPAVSETGLLLDNVCLITPDMTLLFWTVEPDHDDLTFEVELPAEIAATEEA